MRIAQDDGTFFGVWIQKGQGNRENALRGVRVAGLEGHVSRSAVYLVHEGSARRMRDGFEINPPSVYL